MRKILGIESHVELAAAVAFALGFMVLAAIFVSQPLFDPDFWWHLKTGEVMTRSKALLAADPFNSGGSLEVTLRERVILNGYWLWQVIAYAFYRAGGFTGIKLLSLLTLTGVYAVLAVSLWRSRVRLTVALPLFALSLVLLQRFFPLERPQVVSFLLTAVLIGFFVAIRRGARPNRWLYPLMAIWGNVHGGVVVGVVLLALFAGGFCWEARGDRPRLRGILLWCAGGIGASFLNPCGTGYYWSLWGMRDQDVVQLIGEFQSTFTRFASDRALVLLWGLLLLHFFCLWKVARLGRAGDWLVSLLVAVLAVKYMRNVAFAAVALIPMTGYYLEQALRATSVKFQRLWQRACLPLAVVLVIYVFTVAQGVLAARQRGEWTAVSPQYPYTLTNFLKSLPFGGNILSNYNWGGFLIWELSPQYRAFVDGRAIDLQLLRDYHKIGDISLEPVNGRPEYEALMEKYAIDIVALGTEVDSTGVNVLLKYLLNKPEWQPVFLSEQGCVLIRNTPTNASLLPRYKIDKVAFLNRLVAFYDDYLRRYPGDYRRYFGRGELLGYMGRYAEAERDFAMVQRLDPGNPFLSAKLRQLEKLREQAGKGQ